MLVKTVIERIVDSDLGSSLKYCSNTANTTFPVNTPGKVDCNMNSQPHEYFLHLFGKEFLDAIIAETNLLAGTILSKYHLGGCSRLVTYQS